MRRLQVMHACMRMSLYRAHTLSTTHIQYSTHSVQHTLSTAHIQYNTHSVQHTLSTAHTHYSTHSLQHTHIVEIERLTLDQAKGPLDYSLKHGRPLIVNEETYKILQTVILLTTYTFKRSFNRHNLCIVNRQPNSCVLQPPEV